ncbi:glycosyltransferase family 2 protein [Luminiphilus sp. nBUS_07]|uniref:glycosyltransferase family 2 protein n=1 Tax=Luminiphilus sp. nBUS_07 TaxID=3395314 RepID=UPI003EBE7C50
MISIVIRTLNEERYLPELLQSIREQEVGTQELEVVLVDSGSVDGTLEIASGYNCKIARIEKTQFTFGRSLNVGCEASSGDMLVFISGHCVPSSLQWLENLIEPISKGVAEYTYGRQVGRHPTKFSENELFKKYYPDTSAVPQDGFFVNNANSSISREAWVKLKFDEELTGLEDMDFAKRLLALGGKVAYCADASVFHIHDETWKQTQRRYERESYALQSIMPEVQVSVWDALRYICAGVFHDALSAWQKGVFFKEIMGIIRFRTAQFSGTYKGNHLHRAISRQKKETYFYPKRFID